MDTVRMAIIGIGNMGSMHAQYLANGEIPGATLAAVCDTNPERLEWAKNNLPAETKLYATAEELYAAKVCDAVLVATPHYDHPPLVIKGLEMGLHMLSEKPAGVYTKQVREMNEAAEKSDKIFGIMFNQRTTPIYQKLRDLVQSGELGEVRRTNWIITNWFRTQSYYNSGGWRATWAGEGGGVLLNQCPHNLDLWQWTCGMPKRVRAFCQFGKYHDIEVEDDVTAYVEYENGATGVFITTTGEAPGTNRLEVTADNGKVVIEGNELKYYRTRQNMRKFCMEDPGGFSQPEVWNVQVPLNLGDGQQHKGITKDFVSAILNGTPLLAPGIEGINGLSLSNAMKLSSWTDDWVDLPIDEDLYYEKLQEKIKSSTYQKTVSEGGTTDVNGTFGV